MATTVAKVVTRALRILRVIDPDEAPEARHFEAGMEALNAMLQRWEADGLPLGWVAVDNPDTPLPAPDEAEEPIVYNLALRLRTEYGVEMGPDAVQLAISGEAGLRADVTNATHLRSELNLPRAEAGPTGDLSAFLRGD